MSVLERPDAKEALAQRIREATQRLSNEFQGRLTPQAVEKCAQESLERYKAAPVLEFVPLLVERQTRERLIASLQAQS